MITKPKSKQVRFGLAGVSLWVAGTIFVISYNRYREGSDLDSISDLFFISFAAPVAFILIAVFFWLLGVRAALTAVGLVAGLLMISVKLPEYQEERRKARLHEQAEMRKQEISRIASERCANEEKSPQPNAIDHYSVCMVSESLKIRAEMQRGER